MQAARTPLQGAYLIYLFLDLLEGSLVFARTQKLLPSSAQDDTPVSDACARLNRLSW
jgi:hypothetical protein